MARGRARSHECGLKLCPLCGTVSRGEAWECHTCGWHGEFEHNEFAIEYALQRDQDGGRPHRSLVPWKTALIVWAQRLMGRLRGRLDILA
ncbi:MAG: hypothetical protein IT207_00095 [Fimbriimonadaceae bacterium]|nr:hypothetical protein [Fimbriimonadaceae bacterium]